MISFILCKKVLCISVFSSHQLTADTCVQYLENDNTLNIFNTEAICNMVSSRSEIWNVPTRNTKLVGMDENTSAKKYVLR